MDRLAESKELYYFKSLFLQCKRQLCRAIAFVHYKVRHDSGWIDVCPYWDSTMHDKCNTHICGRRRR